MNPEEILDKYAGEAEKRLRVFFDEARSDPPAILFFDDFDVLAFKRAAQTDAAPALIATFLSELDSTSRNNSGVLVIAATNAPWTLDPALLRAGRFNHMFFVPPPSFEARKRILSKAISEVPGHETVDTGRIARKSAGFSGADLCSLADWVMSATLAKALAAGCDIPVTAALFEEGMRAFRPSALDWLAVAKTAIKQSQHSEQLQQILSGIYRA